MRFLAVVLALLFAAPAAFAQGCERCEQELQLDQTAWNCLLERVPRMRQSTTDTVFFSLTPQVCGAMRSGVMIPDARRGNNTPATRVYRLSQTQLQCLASRGRPSAGPVVFNFRAECNIGAAVAPVVQQPDYYAQARQQAAQAPAPAPAAPVVLQPMPAAEPEDAPAASPYDTYRRMQRSQ